MPPIQTHGILRWTIRLTPLASTRLATAALSVAVGREVKRLHTTQTLNAALAGRYTIEREVGQGGMATVYLARDLKHDRNVALKVLKPELGAVLGVERFLGEIKVTANLQHPNLLPLFDSGEANGLLFYVMPFVDGETLRARIEREKQLPVEDAVRIATAVASALTYAHEHGVIHRDLKPENILLQAGQPVIADFGIALAVSNAGGARVTQTGLSLGTPQYMSPEQATGDRVVDGRTDIYSLGAVTYEMLTGDPPHVASTAQAVIAKVLTERPADVRLARSAVGEHVAYAVDKALEKLPADRWITAQAFAEALSGERGARCAPLDAHRGARSGVPWRGIAIVSVLAAIACAAWDFTHRPEADTLQLTRQITFDGTVVGAALSPDGAWLAYVTDDCQNEYADCGRTLSVREVDGTQSVRLVHWPTLGTRVAWSSDGANVAFSGSPDSTPVALYLAGRLGGSLRRGPARGEVSDLGFSPDGKRVTVIFDADDHPVLRHFDAATWSPLDSTALARPGRALSFAYSPDGRRMLARVAVHGMLYLFLMDRGGALLDSLPQGYERNTVRFTPDGSAVLLVTAAPGVADNVVRVPIVRDRLRADRASLSLAQVQDNYDGDFDVARTGRVAIRLSPTMHEIRVLTLGQAGGEWRRLTHRTGYLSPTGLRDSTLLVAASTDNLGDNLYRFPLDGAEPQAITASGGGADRPAVSPSGRAVLYSYTSFQTGVGGELRVVDVAGGTVRTIARRGGHGFQYHWLSDSTLAVYQEGTVTMTDTTGKERSHLTVPDSLYNGERDLKVAATTVGGGRSAYWSARVGAVVVLDFATGRASVFFRHVRRLSPAGFLPDGSILALEPGNGRAANPRERKASLVRLSPDGRTITRVADVPGGCEQVVIDPAGRRAVCSVQTVRADVWLADRAERSTR